MYSQQKPVEFKGKASEIVCPSIIIILKIFIIPGVLDIAGKCWHALDKIRFDKKTLGVEF